MCIYTLKNTRLKKSKHKNFSRGDSPWVFFKKIEIFPPFYLRQNKPGKCVSRYSTEQKCLSRL